MTVEILVGISIIVVSMLAAMFVTQKAISISRQSLHIYQTSFLLEEGAEVVRVVRDNAWSNISNGTYYPTFDSVNKIWTLSSTSSTIGIFTRTVNITNVNRDDTSKIVSLGGTPDSGTKLVTVTVSWPEGGATVVKTLQFYITDIFS